MITALDQITLRVEDVQTGSAAMAQLFGRDGASAEERAVFRLDNVALELLPLGGGKAGLAALGFEVGNAESAFRAAERRALAPRAPVTFAETDATGTHCEGHCIELDEAATFGVAIKLAEYTARAPIAHSQQDAGAVSGLDHVVIRTAHPNRAAALYGARLGLDMRLDRTEPKWGSRLMFFRCGDLIIEIVHDLKEAPSDAPDRLWGLSWRIASADAAQARLKSAGFNVSDVRPGRKPGTRVITVRDGTLGVPTLMVEPANQ